MYSLSRLPIYKVTKSSLHGGGRNIHVDQRNRTENPDRCTKIYVSDLDKGAKAIK